MEQTVRIASQLGQALWGARKLSSLTQKAVGARVGLLPKTISALERTPERASIESLLRILSALGLEMVLRPKDTLPSKTSDW